MQDHLLFLLFFFSFVFLFIKYFLFRISFGSRVSNVAKYHFIHFSHFSIENVAVNSYEIEN